MPMKRRCRSSQNLVSAVWLTNSGACEGNSGRTRTNSAKNRTLKRKPEQDLPWLMGFGWIREVDLGWRVVESAIDEAPPPPLCGGVGICGSEMRNEERKTLI